MKTKIITVLLVLFILLPAAASADVGPKPSITIKGVNMPSEVCYMDLLVESDQRIEADHDFRQPEYNQDIIDILEGYYADGWACSVIAKDSLVWGNIRCSSKTGESSNNFGYMPPDEFRIIVVTKSGDITVSNVIDRKAFDSIIDFDYDTGIAEERAAMPNILSQFAITLILTLLIEGLILILFKFSFRKYWWILLLVNFLTQAALAAAVSGSMYVMGIVGAIFIYLIAEFAILITEGIIYGVVLKQHKVGRRILYAMTANIVSFMAGIVIIIIFI